MKHAFECWAGRGGECRAGCSCLCHIPAPAAVRIHWRATNRSGAAHGFPNRPLLALALCGAVNQDERYDWPRSYDCPDCRHEAAAQGLGL